MAVATFLDRETTRLDTLIEKKQRQIELLQEKRAALISQVVTKGLDPTVPMKDSGCLGLGIFRSIGRLKIKTHFPQN
jgi:type I restriction enzyme S subunit